MVRSIRKLLIRANFPTTLVNLSPPKNKLPLAAPSHAYGRYGRNFSPVGFTCDPVVLTLWRCVTQTAKGDFAVFFVWSYVRRMTGAPLSAQRGLFTNLPYSPPCVDATDCHCENKSSRNTSTLPLGMTTGVPATTSRTRNPFPSSGSIRRNQLGKSQACSGV